MRFVVWSVLAAAANPEIDWEIQKATQVFFDAESNEAEQVLKQAKASSKKSQRIAVQGQNALSRNRKGELKDKAQTEQNLANARFDLVDQWMTRVQKIRESAADLSDPSPRSQFEVAEGMMDDLDKMTAMKKDIPMNEAQKRLVEILKKIPRSAESVHPKEVKREKEELKKNKNLKNPLKPEQIASAWSNIDQDANDLRDEMEGRKPVEPVHPVSENREEKKVVEAPKTEVREVKKEEKPVVKKEEKTQTPAVKKTEKKVESTKVEPTVATKVEKEAVLPKETVGFHVTSQYEPHRAFSTQNLLHDMIKRRVLDKIAHRRPNGRPVPDHSNI